MTWEDRFWSKVDKNGPVDPELGTSCWLWQGQTDKDGYGIAWVGEKKEAAHRVAYKLLVGPIFPEQVSRHQCQTKNCCNPDHVIMGTQKENIEDMDRMGKRPAYNPRRLTEDEVRAIRKMYWYDLMTKPEICKSTGLGDVLVGRLVAGRSYKEVAPLCMNQATHAVQGRDSYLRVFCEEHAKLYAEERGGIVESLSMGELGECYYVG